MNNIFNLNSPVMQFLSKVFDLLILNLLWLICCIPIITIGPATTAMYYVAMKIADDEYSEVLRPFFHSFKQNFLQGIILELIFIVSGLLLFFDYRFCLLFDGTTEKIMIGAFIFFGVVYLVIVSYTFPLLSQYSNTIGGTIKNALVLAMSKVITALEISLLNLAPILSLFLFPEVIGWIVPLLIFLAPAFIALLNSMLFKKVLADFIKMQTSLAEKDAEEAAKAAEVLPEESTPEE
jgi:uncharacterized membrane protein YesL